MNGTPEMSVRVIASCGPHGQLQKNCRIKREDCLCSTSF
jgi:hypothetical protein